MPHNPSQKPPRKTPPEIDRMVSVAPMMDWTDRYCRVFHRCLTKTALLYTEMVTTGALIHGDQPRHLDFHDIEHPLALQLGGSEPAALAECARLAESWGYDEVNLNVGCPSDRVQSGRFGACLMAEPALVAECMAAMIEAVDIPVTVKCRLGIDDQDAEKSLRSFITESKRSGCKTFIVHARKAWLEGLSPKENRDVPPLNYDLVYQIKAEHPDLEILINGGIQTVSESKQHLANGKVDGVMLGRAAYQTPYVLAELEAELTGWPVKTREAVLQEFIPHLERWQAAGVPLKSATRHILGLYNGEKGAKAFRRFLSETRDDDAAIIAYLQQLSAR